MSIPALKICLCCYARATYLDECIVCDVRARHRLKNVPSRRDRARTTVHPRAHRRRHRSRTAVSFTASATALVALVGFGGLAWASSGTPEPAPVEVALVTSTPVEARACFSTPDPERAVEWMRPVGRKRGTR